MRLLSTPKSQFNGWISSAFNQLARADYIGRFGGAGCNQHVRFVRRMTCPKIEQQAVMKIGDNRNSNKVWQDWL